MKGRTASRSTAPITKGVDEDDAAIDDDNRKLMTVSLQSDLADGIYTVRWRTLSADDGDDAEGEFQFNIQADGPEAEAAPTAVPTEAPTAAAENAQPSPTNTAQAESTEAQPTPTTAPGRPRNTLRSG